MRGAVEGLQPARTRGASGTQRGHARRPASAQARIVAGGKRFRPAEKRQSRVDGQVCPSTRLLMVRPPAGSPYETSTNRQVCELGTSRRLQWTFGLRAPSGLRRLVQVSRGWSRVGCALDLRAYAGWGRTRPVPALRARKNAFSVQKCGLGTGARPWGTGRLRRRGRDLGKRPRLPFERVSPGRGTPSGRLRNAPFPSQTAILERERGNMGAASPSSKEGGGRGVARADFALACTCGAAVGSGAVGGRMVRLSRRGARPANPSDRAPAKRKVALPGQNAPSL